MMNMIRKFAKTVTIPQIVIHGGLHCISFMYKLKILFSCHFKKSAVMSSERALDVLSKYKKNIHPEVLPNKRQSYIEKSKIDISVIIPCYNVAKYIRDCLNSILNQTFQGTLEVIIVNDGSTDNTLEIIEAMNLPKSWKVINKANGGMSSARNAGIDIARGKYLMFVDSDDVLADDGITCLYDNATSQNADIVTGHINRLDNPNKSMFQFNDKRIPLDRGQISLDVPGMVMGSLFKRELWSGVRFPVGYLFEDTVILYLIAPRAVRYNVIDNCVYLYRSHKGGITKSRRNSDAVDTLYVVSHLLNIASQLNLKIETLNEISLRQLSRFVIERLAPFGDDNLMEAAFVYSRLVYLRYFPDGFKQSQTFYEAAVNRSFSENNYRLWMAASEAWLRIDQLHSL